jgi:hypothetical protein
MFLNGRTGSEVVLRDTALSLLRAGHRPIVYTRSFGPISEQLRAAYVSVTNDLTTIKQPVDIIHAAHHPTLAAAVAQFPSVPAICLYQDFVHWLDAPQDLPTVRRHLAVDHALRERLISEGGISPENVDVLLNSVDLTRFQPGPPLPDRPKRALAFAKNIEHVEAVREACRRSDLDVEVIGAATGRVVGDIERLLPEYDLVFASALSALEAMACGRAVVVCDGRGLAGFCDPTAYETWRPLNFGRRTLARRPTADALAAEIARYDRTAAETVSERTRSEADRASATGQLVALYRQVIAEHRASPIEVGATLAALSKYIERWSPRPSVEWPWMIEREELIERAAGGMSLSQPIFDEPIRTAAGQPFTHLKLLSGFSFPETWGVWSNAAEATLALRCPPIKRGQLVMRFMVGPVKDPDPLSIDVRMKASRRAQWVFGEGDRLKTIEKSVPIESTDVSDDGLLYVHFRVDGARSPASVAISTDERQVGFGLQSVTVHQAA